MTAQGTVRPVITAPLPPGPRLPVALQTILLGSYRERWLPKLREEFGDIFRLSVFPGRSVVVLADLDHIKTVFSGPVSTFHAGEGNVVLKPVMGENSVLVTDEDDHLRVRKLLMPAFHGAALRGYRDMMTGLAAEEVSRWPVGTPFRSHDRMQGLTLEIILRVVFGVGEGARLDELRALLRSTVDIGLLDILGWHSPKLQRFKPWRTNALVQRRVDELVYEEIAERRRADDLESRTDVLSRLLTVPSDDDKLSDAELRDQLITLLLAGHETTATALAWAFHELARNPAEQASATRAADEGDEKYLDAVTKESLRLHPVISAVARKLTEDIEIGGYRVPAGHTVAPSIILLHGDKTYYPDPAEFRPGRFVDGGPPTGTWLPFGGGVRRCLGAGFSLMEADIVLGEVLRRFRLSPDRLRPEPVHTRNITQVPGRGARIVATERRLASS